MASSSKKMRIADYYLKSSHLWQGKIPVQKFKSSETGISIILAQVDGPTVSGHFALATEAHDDDGLPHTLEHLIFLGSQNYPFKGVLDLLANRCLSDGTNAWTDTDHTCYMVTTAGSGGFLNLLPIYVEHILYPTLTEAAFITEVHHVNGDGEDAGVVYCEMQARENSGESRVHLEMLRSMYPENCGYRSETGGIMKNLRESTTPDKIREYHRNFYRPENLYLIVVGQISAQEIIEALQPIHDMIKSKGERGPFLRPWEGEVPKLEASISREVLYPCDDEDSGMVYVAWRGPSAVTQLTSMIATIILMEYLTETSISPLQSAFVEVDDPLASSVVYSLIENKESTVYLMFNDVPKSKINLIEETLLKVLDPSTLKLDMPRMQTVIKRRMLEQLSKMEREPHESIALVAIGDVLYGHEEKDFESRLNVVDTYKALLEKPAEFWMETLKDMVESPRVVIRGAPSIELKEKISTEEQERVSAQKATLGEKGLKALSKKLEKAKEQNETPPSKEVLKSVPIPTVESISFHPAVSWDSSKPVTGKPDLSKIGLFTRFTQLSSNFIYVFAVMDTNNLPKNLRLYLPLLMELLLESPVMDGDVEIPYEKVVAGLAEDTLVTSSSIGVCGERFSCGSFAQYATIFMQMERDKYEDGVNWLKKILFHVKLTLERVKVVAAKMENSVSAMKRSGRQMVKALIRDTIYDNPGSNIYASNPIRQQKFLEKLLKSTKCNEGEQSQILKDLEALRVLLVDNLYLHVSSDFEALQDPIKPWINFKSSSAITKAPKIVKNLSFVNPKSGHFIIGLGTVESNYLYRSTKCLSDYESPDLAPLMVYLKYLCQTEGPMWKKLRGLGLSYGYSMHNNLDEGLLYLTLSRSTHVVSAFSAAQDIIESYLNGTEDWDDTLLDSAKSSLIYDMVQDEISIADVVVMSLIQALKGTDPEYKRRLFKKILEVKIEDLQRVSETYLRNLFNPEISKTAIVCHIDKVEAVTSGFAGLNVKLEYLKSLDGSFLAQIAE